MSQTPLILVGTSLGITYDAAGRIQSITYPGNTSITYGYDAMGNVNQLTLDRSGLITELISNVTYQPFGPLKALTLGNGLARSIDHDQAYRITTINDPVYDVTLTYDANGNILYQSRNAGDLGTGYDALDKLTSATGSLDSYAYTYDRNANRLTDTLNGTLTAYNYEALSNRLNQVGLDPVILDANGNTTQLRGITLDYSPDSRLIAANDSYYSYNGIGERVLKTDVSKTTVYQYGRQGQLMTELNDSGQVEKAYVYINGQPFAVVDYTSDSTGALYYIHGDHLGTPQGLTNQAGIIVWLADYSPFGLAAVNEDPDLDGNPVTFNLRFAGQYFDGESGLHYNYFRDYDPGTGRYVQSDPIGLDGGLNTYGYVGGNPLSGIDPNGLVKWTGDIRIVDLSVGPKIKKYVPRIPVFGRFEITIDLESDCVDGEKIETTIRVVNPTGDTGLPSVQILLGSVNLNDGKSNLSKNSVVGDFTLSLNGNFSRSGQVTTGSASGTASVKGFSFGEINVSGNSFHLFPPTIKKCTCD